MQLDVSKMAWLLRWCMDKMYSTQYYAGPLENSATRNSLCRCFHRRLLRYCCWLCPGAPSSGIVGTYLTLVCYFQIKFLNENYNLRDEHFSFFIVPRASVMR